MTRPADAVTAPPADAFTFLAELGPQLALACSDDGSILALNDHEGRVEFYELAPELRPLPLVIERDTARAVLLDRAGRHAYVLANDPSLLVYDLQGRLEARHPLDAGERDLDAQAEREPPDPDDAPDDATYRLAILTTPSPVAWAMAAEIANVNEGRAWLEQTLEPNADRLLWPDRFTRLAQDPSGDLLAVLDDRCVVLDHEQGSALASIDRGLDLPMLFDYGEGTHTIDFAADGLLMAATTSVSGNPFVELDWFDPRRGEQVATSETWQQRWPLDREVHIHDPTTHPMPAAIPPGERLVVFRRACTELWTHEGLHASWPRVRDACVIPSFDPGRPCRAPRTIELVGEQIVLVDLVRGERTTLALDLHPDALRWIEFLPEGELVLRTTDTLLLGNHRGDRWVRAALPEGRRIQRLALARAHLGQTRELFAFVLDDHHALWTARMLCPRTTSGREFDPRELARLEAELAEHPDDPERLAVYADALAQRGEPLGELIHLQLQGDDAAASALIEREAGRLRPCLAELPAGAWSLEWRLGLVRAASFHVTNRDELGLVLAFLGCPAARLLESLSLEFAATIEARYRAELRERFTAYLAAARRWPRLQGLSSP